MIASVSIIAGHMRNQIMHSQEFPAVSTPEIRGKVTVYLFNFDNSLFQQEYVET